jgi:hypothetical protein
MSSRTLLILLTAIVVGAVTFFVARQFGHTLLFLPLFLFWSWGDRGRPAVANDECLAAGRLSDRDGCRQQYGDSKDDAHNLSD